MAKKDFNTWFSEDYYPVYGGTKGQEEMMDLYRQYVMDSSDKVSSTFSGLQDGSISALDAQGQLAEAQGYVSPEEYDYLNNLISKEFSDNANSFTEHMRDTSLISAAQQLQTQGLNPGSVINTGGAGSGSGALASNVKENTKANIEMNKFNQKAAMERTLISMIGGLTNSAIHGSSLGLARSAASRLASSAAHSALRYLQ